MDSAFSSADELVRNGELRTELAPYADEYRARSIVLGRRIAFTENGVAEEGEVRAIGDDGALVVMTARGVRRLSSGEISVRPV